jgi:hypothetical protein
LALQKNKWTFFVHGLKEASKKESTKYCHLGEIEGKRLPDRETIWTTVWQTTKRYERLYDRQQNDMNDSLTDNKTSHQIVNSHMIIQTESYT